jgi:succinyl-diaminopimelate desuccinylase
MAAYLTRLEQELMPRLAARRTAMPVVPEAARHATLNINAVHGGEPEGLGGLPSPCVPDSCRVVLDRRYLIEEDPAEVRRELVELLERLRGERSGFRYRIRDVMEFRPVMTDPAAPVPRAVAAAIASVLGRPAEIIASPGTYDQKHIVRIGKLEDCVAYGPGILDLAHQPDEYVEIDAMLTAAKVMALATLELLGARA